MPFDAISFRELVRATGRHLSPRRAMTFGAYLPIWGGFRLAIDGAQRLDDLLTPGYREQKVEAPVFIFANPRSGTTLMHRLMSMDDEHFVSMRLFETIFPSSSIMKGFQKLARIDRAHLGGRLRRLVDSVNARTFDNRWEDVHKLGLDEAEEDECLFCYPVVTPTSMLLVPFVDEVKSQLWFDELPPDVRGRFMDYYEGCIKRLLWAHGGQRHYLNKNVFFIPRVRSVHERFPDARFIYMVRHPYEVMPSFLNMFYAAWRTHSPDIPKDSPEVRALAEVGYDYYRYAMMCQDLLPKDRFKVVKYRDLVANPRSTVEDVYHWLGMPITSHLRARLDEATEKQKHYLRPSDHTLEEFGFTKDDVYEALRPVFEKFGFER